MSFAPDFGLKLQQQGASSDFEVHLVNYRLDHISVVAANLFTTIANLQHDGQPHAVSLDFDLDILRQIADFYPEELETFIADGQAGRWMTGTTHELAEPLALSVTAALGELQQAEQEQYVPLVVRQARRPEPGWADADYDYSLLDPVPADEECQQRTSEGYDNVAALAECRRFRDLIRQKCGPEPDGVKLMITSSPSDDGYAYQVMVRFEQENRNAEAYARHVEEHPPVSWDDTEPELFQVKPRRSRARRARRQANPTKPTAGEPGS